MHCSCPISCPEKYASVLLDLKRHYEQILPHYCTRSAKFIEERFLITSGGEVGESSDDM